jgi:VanZ family protein
MRPAQMNRKLLAWLPTFCWLVVLTCFSTDLFSADHTGKILLKIIHWIYGPVSDQQFQLIHLVVRKGAHFFSYGLLSFFAFFAWRATLPDPRPWLVKWAGLAFALTLAAGSSDEIHQHFVASRTSSPWDVLLDMTGAFFFQLLLMATIKRPTRSSVRHS